ncbi:MAG: nitrous oxide reductase family maturation protein NosD [Gammaproteobacteria bacterium]|nr:nitrous oxide reductase family maturation protein NosD [Gammaproteobacteria bacterium]MCW8988866.1 nitrous oxide reductase family maturation protein NosD [Gammaproteobacteria bacterium]
MRYIWKCVVVCWLNLLNYILLLFKQKTNNPLVSHWLAGGLFFISAAFISFSVHAEEIKVTPGSGKLQAAINSARKGDTLILKPGIYSGSINIDRSLTLLGSQDSIIDGEGTGHVVVISAANVRVKGFTIQHSGNNLNTEDSAIFVTVKGDNARIENNYFKNNLIGVYLKGPKSAIVSDNIIIGSQFHRVNDRGNGVYLWNTPGSVIKNNDIRYGRDGIFVNVSQNNIFDGNRLSDLRFAIHYMYTNNSEVKNNVSINNNVGYALMFSHHIVAKNNQSIGDNERGLFFNFTNYSTIEGNSVSGGTEKCVFIYNANFNAINNNSFADCDIGIHFTAGSESNKIYSNAFINNRTQVKYVGTRYIEWSNAGKGNYWSDNAAFDIDKNGIADQPYRPNDLVDQIVWRHPMAKLLLNSPSVQILKWAQSEFPGLHPGGVTDSVPLMLAPEINNVVNSKEKRKVELING